MCSWLEGGGWKGAVMVGVNDRDFLLLCFVSGFSFFFSLYFRVACRRPPPHASTNSSTPQQYSIHCSRIALSIPYSLRNNSEGDRMINPRRNLGVGIGNVN